MKATYNIQNLYVTHTKKPYIPSCSLAYKNNVFVKHNPLLLTGRNLKSSLLLTIRCSLHYILATEICIKGFYTTKMCDLVDYCTVLY